MIWGIVLCCILCGCTALTTKSNASFGVTFLNYKSGVDMLFKRGYTDRGDPVATAGSLYESSRAEGGARLGVMVPRGELPEWVEFQWKEFARADRDVEYTSEQLAAVPIKSVRLPVRSLVPPNVFEEAKRSAPDPQRANLPLKSLELYFTWTRAGVKTRWKLYQGCCTVLAEGGQSITAAAAP
jgi:hypothetical protein